MEHFALFEPAEEGGFVISFPDFGWGVSQGDTEQEGQEMAVALLETLIGEHIRKGEPLPRATRPRGKKYRTIRLPALEGAKATLYAAFVASGIRKSELARRIGMSKANVDRLFDLRHHSRMDQIEAAFKVLGKELSIEVKDAA